MLCKNTGSENAQFQIDGAPGVPPRKYDVPPGGKVDIAEGYCRSYQAPTKRPMRPIITQLHPAMRPMGETAGGEVTQAPAASSASNADVMAAISRLSAELSSLKEENRSLRSENRKIRASLPDGGVAADEGGGEPEPDGIATSPKAAAKAKARAEAEAKARGEG